MTEEDTFNALRKWTFEALCKAYDDYIETWVQTATIDDEENFDWTRTGWTSGEYGIELDKRRTSKGQP